jgi:hypothetical protein
MVAMLLVGGGRAEPPPAPYAKQKAKAPTTQISKAAAPLTKAHSSTAPGQVATLMKKTGKALKGVAGSAGKATGPADKVLDVVKGGKRALETERKYKEGELSDEERALDHARNGAGIGGSWAGAYVGGVAGAKAGAIAGSVFGPEGTVVGGLVGASVGGFVGGILGEKAALKVVDAFQDTLSGAWRRARGG